MELRLEGVCMPKKERRIAAVAGALLHRLTSHFVPDAPEVSPHDIPIIDQPSPADIARAHELIREHGLENLLRP